MFKNFLRLRLQNKKKKKKMICMIARILYVHNTLTKMIKSITGGGAAAPHFLFGSSPSTSHPQIIESVKHDEVFFWGFFFLSPLPPHFSNWFFPLQKKKKKEKNIEGKERGEKGGWTMRCFFSFLFSFSLSFSLSPP